MYVFVLIHISCYWCTYKNIRNVCFTYRKSEVVSFFQDIEWKKVDLYDFFRELSFKKMWSYVVFPGVILKK